MEFFAKPDGIYNERSQRIRLKGCNYFGLETNIYTVHGLWATSLDSILAFLAKNKFNAIRLPIALDLVLKMDQLRPSGIDFSKNPSLQGLTVGQLLDKVITKCREYNMLVMLDMHVHDSQGPIEELWYTNKFNEAKWIQGWQILVTRYRGWSHVFACDLKNEPHGRATWAVGNKDTDWAKAAERIANAIHKINPKLLIFVEGIENASKPKFGSFWGGNFMDVANYQIKLTVPNKLVYSPHVYGPDVFMQQYFKDPNFPKNMPAIWNEQFGFIKKNGIGCLIVGEWGGKYKQGSLDETWQNEFGNWLITNDVDSFYWCFNPNGGDSGGLVESDWTTPVQRKLDLLARVHPNPVKFNFGQLPRKLI
jgi:endoglucanase